MKMNVEIDLDDVLADRNQIAIIWDIDDVKAIRPDLTDEQAWEVLSTAKKWHDRDYGVTLGSLESIANHFFGEASSEAEED